MSDLNVYVFYHYPCHDGFLAQLLIKRIIGNKASIITCPLQHGAAEGPDLSLIQPNSAVLFVDIAPKPDLLAELEANENVATINVWDHHIDFRKSYDVQWKAQILPNFFDVTMELARPSVKTTFWFCNEISGSKLAPIAAWWWAQDQLSNSYAVVDAIGDAAATMYTHPIVVHASDYDTWTKAYPATDAVFAYYRNYKYDDEGPWNQLLDRITGFDLPGYRDVVIKGEAMLYAIKTMVEKLADGETPRPLEIAVPSGTYAGVVCNAYSLLANDLAEVFREQHGYDFAIMYNVTPTKIALSIRSKPGIPANEIAQMWGGGGHAQSAGAGIVGTTKMIHWLKEFAFDPNS